MSETIGTHEADQKRIAELEREVERLKKKVTDKEREHRLIMGRYVTDEVMRALLSSGGTIAGERREVTMMFTDIRRSTELSEMMDPEDYINLLNHYLDDMITIVDSWQGNILEFAGDAIISVFGAPLENPDAAQSAIYAAVCMQRRMVGVNKWNLAQGYPAIEMGVGIHTGDAIVGCIGSETRMKYDVIGRNMNLASRAEGFTKGGQILVTDETLAAAGEDVHENLSGMLHVSPKGIANFVNLHDVIGIGNLRIPGA